MMGNSRANRLVAGLTASLVMIAGCAGNIGQPPTRLGMVKQPDTGLMYGSVIERNIVTDASFFDNRKLKVRTRNTSGDQAFRLERFSQDLQNAYDRKGYAPTDDDDFGLLVDVNVIYSGQVQTNLATEYGFLGAAAGGIAGHRSSANAGTAIGVVAGATLGNILGSYITDDTYIIIADVTFGVIKDTRKGSSKRVTFSRSPTPGVDEDEAAEKEKARRKRGFKRTYSTKISVYAGGRNVPQARITEEVRNRMIRIVGDII